jgi:hypothetical protein
VITPQIADPSSRQSGRPIDTRPQISDPTGDNIWSQVSQRYSILTVSRKVTSASTISQKTATFKTSRSFQQPKKNMATDSTL